MWELDHKEVWAAKNGCFWTVVLEKTPESPLDCKETKSVNRKENQSWIFIERTDAEAEAPILWPPDAKSRLIGKDPDAGKDWKEEGQQRLRWLDSITELNAHEFEQTLMSDEEGQGNLARCNPWGRKEVDTTWWLNDNMNWVQENREKKLEMASTDNPFKESYCKAKGIWRQERIFLGWGR